MQIQEHELRVLTEIADGISKRQGIEITTFDSTQIFLEKVTNEGIKLSDQVLEAFGLNQDLKWNVVQGKGEQSFFAYGVYHDSNPLLENALATFAADYFWAGNKPSRPDIGIAGINAKGKQKENGTTESVIVAGRYKLNELVEINVGVKRFDMPVIDVEKSHRPNWITNFPFITIPTNPHEPIFQTAGFVTKAMMSITGDQSTFPGYESQAGYKSQRGDRDFYFDSFLLHDTLKFISDAGQYAQCIYTKPVSWKVNIPLQLSPK